MVENSNKETLDFLKKRKLNSREAALYLGISVITLRRKAGKGEIASYKDGRFHFEMSDLDEYLLSKRRSSVEQSREVAAMLNFKISKKWKI
ncbi:helix-turn-helix domain-containing protein [Cloacibacterium sp.]|uniref:helix-turn-helix domain-containing protein n=1 Tax=Cloacibacterium sp. TaxID=1913682 RepID=UPI0039E3C07B